MQLGLCYSHVISNATQYESKENKKFCEDTFKPSDKEGEKLGHLILLNKSHSEAFKIRSLQYVVAQCLPSLLLMCRSLK